MLTDAQQRNAAKKFAAEWEGRGYEKGETHAFWMELLQTVCGVVNPAQFITFEYQVQLGHTSFVDAYIPETKVINWLIGNWCHSILVIGVIGAIPYKQLSIKNLQLGNWCHSIQTTFYQEFNWCHSIQTTFYQEFAIKLFSFIVTRNANVLPVLFFTSTLQVMCHP